jgi:serine/threonine protein kinase
MIVLAIAVLIFVFKRYRKQKKAKTIRLRSSQSEEHINNETHTLLTKTLPSTSVPQQIIVSANEFVIERVIGGSYGKVCIGKWNNVPVVWKYGRKKQNIDNLMSEIKTIIDLPPHPNVVQVFGVSLDTPQTFFIMEYCAGGNNLYSCYRTFFVL